MGHIYSFFNFFNILGLENEGMPEDLGENESVQGELKELNFFEYLWKSHWTILGIFEHSMEPSQAIKF